MSAIRSPSCSLPSVGKTPWLNLDCTPSSLGETYVHVGFMGLHRQQPVQAVSKLCRPLHFNRPTPATPAGNVVVLWVVLVRLEASTDEEQVWLSQSRANASQGEPTIARSKSWRLLIRRTRPNWTQRWTRCSMR